MLPYATTNEPRTNWRDVMWSVLHPLMAAQLMDGDEMESGSTSLLAAAATRLNNKMWDATALGRFNGGKKIVFKGEMTPRVFDPMSTLLFGYASCTGVSILYVDALRTIGIPARVTGTPAWHVRH